MGAFFTFEQIKKDLANTYIPLVCIIVITLLTTSCNTVPTKRTTSTDTAANSLTTKEKSDNETAENMQKEVECRYVDVTGSRFKRKVCKTKEAWAAISKKNRKDADDLVRGVNDQSAISAGGGVDSAGGRVNNPTSPGF